MSRSAKQLVLLAVIAGLMAVACQAIATTWNLSSDYSSANNPSGAWSYGWKPSLTGTFTSYVIDRWPPSGTTQWAGRNIPEP